VTKKIKNRIMKTKRVVALLIMIILVFNTSFAKTWQEFLDVTWWQKQTGSVNEQVWFYPNNEFEKDLWYMSTNQRFTIKGKYYISSSLITIEIDGKSETYNLKYISDDKIILSNKNEELIYAKVTSSEDHWLANYLQSVNGFFNPSTISQQTCQCCYGHNGGGRCNVCQGNGKVRGFPSGTWWPCNYCNGTGQCPHCNGTGIFKK
jgi:hypothetical protein